MKTFSVAFVVSGFFGLFSFGDDKNETVIREINKLKGEWRIVSQKNDGEKSKSSGSYHFSENEYSCKLDRDPTRVRNGEADKSVFQYSLLQSDSRFYIKSTVKSPANNGAIRNVIFRHKDDTLELCFILDPKKESDIPKDFTAEAGSGQALIILKR